MRPRTPERVFRQVSNWALSFNRAGEIDVFIETLLKKICNPPRRVTDVKELNHDCPPKGHQSPEGWVRGKAALDTSTGQFTMVLGLETDWVNRGVKGKMKVALKDSKNATIATVEMGQEMGIPGKDPGKARIEEFTLVKTVPADIAKRTAALDVNVEYTGPQFGLWGIPLQAVLDAIKIVKVATS